MPNIITTNDPISPLGAKILANGGWVRQPTRLIDQNLVRIATFGDSTAQVGDRVESGGIDAHDVEQIDVPWPVSGTVAVFAGGFGKDSAPRFYPRCRVCFNGGIGGESTTSMLARDLAAASIGRKAITDLVASRPDVVILRAGSINDIQALTAAASTQDDIDAIYDRHVEIISRIMASGAHVIDEGIWGYSAAVGAEDLAYRCAAIVALNDRYADLGDVFGYKYNFLSPVGILSDETGAYLTDISTDGVHIVDGFGSTQIGYAEATLIESMFGPSPLRPVAENKFSNPLFADVSTTIWGDYPTDTATQTAGNAVRANAEISHTSGEPMYTVDCLADGTFRFVPSLPISGASPDLSVTAGDVFEMTAKLTITNSHTSSQKISLSTILDIVHTDGRKLSYQIYEMNIEFLTGEAKTLDMSLPPIVMPDDSANLDSSTTLIKIAAKAESGPFTYGMSDFAYYLS